MKEMALVSSPDKLRPQDGVKSRNATGSNSSSSTASTDRTEATATTVGSASTVDNNSIVNGFGSNRMVWEERAKKHTPTGIDPKNFTPTKVPKSPARSISTPERGTRSRDRRPQIVSPRSDIIARKSHVGNVKLLRAHTTSGASQSLDHAKQLKDFPSAVSQAIVTKILEKVKEEGGNRSGGGLPQCITFTLLGTDNVNTYAKTMGQIFLLLGAKLVGECADEVELIPLEQLGRPRIDVVASCSGSFRDLHMNQMILIDKVIKMAAEADEPEEMNFVRKHALEQASDLDLPLKEAATRVFSNSAGAYSANIASWIKANDWKTEDQLRERFISRKGHAFDYDRPNSMEYRGDLFQAALKNSDVTVQNVDLSEIISVTDVPHYYDSDPTKVIQNLRDDKKKPLSLWANALKNKDREVLTLAETLRLDALKKILSPDYYEKVLATPEGVQDISNCLRNVFGWAVTAGEVDTFVFEISFNVFIEDKKMLERLRENDSQSYQTLVTTFLKANEHGYWVTNSQNPTNLRRLLVDEWRKSGSLSLTSMGRSSSDGLSSSRHGAGLSSSRHGDILSRKRDSLSSSNHGSSSKIRTPTRTLPKPKQGGMLSSWRRRKKASNDRELSVSSHGEMSSIPTWRRGFSSNRNTELSRSVHG